MELITGRLTENATVSELSNGRKVVNFSVALNYEYKPKAGEAKKHTTYVRCAYWLNPNRAKALKKGVLVELHGHLSLNQYENKAGENKAAIAFHVDKFQVQAWPCKVATTETIIQQPVSEMADDLPF